MAWFWNRQAPDHGERIAELERLVSTLTARVVKAEATASESAERAYRYMKKAEARARRELDDPNQEPAADAASTRATPGTSSSRRAAWGARGRRLNRPAPVIDAEALGERAAQVFGNGSA